MFRAVGKLLSLMFIFLREISNLVVKIQESLEIHPILKLKCNPLQYCLPCFKEIVWKLSDLSEQRACRDRAEKWCKKDFPSKMLPMVLFLVSNYCGLLLFGIKEL